MRAAFIGTEKGAAPGDGDHMIEIGAALSCHQIAEIPDTVKVRAFQKAAAGAFPDGPGRAEQGSGPDIDLFQSDLLPAGVQRGVGAVPGPSVFKIKGGIDASHGNPHGRRPAAGGIRRGNDEVPPAVQGGCDIENTVFIADGGGPDAAGILRVFQGKGVGIRDAVPDLRPVHQICAAVNRNAGKIFKGAGDEVIIFSAPADTGIRVKARQDGIAVLHGEASFPGLTVLTCCRVFCGYTAVYHLSGRRNK